MGRDGVEVGVVEEDAWECARRDATSRHPRVGR
jgi:hypothetical protein